MSADRARMLIGAGLIPQARELLRARLAVDPDDLESIGLAALAAELAGDHREALRLLTRPLAAMPDDPELLGILAWARAGEGDVHGARAAALRRALLAPDDWTALCDLAGIDLRAGRSDRETLAAARRAVELAPEESATHARLGAVHLARREHREARREFAESLRIDPESTEARHDLAIAGLRGGALIRSAGEFARLATRAEVAPAATHNLAIIAVRLLWVIQLVLVVVAAVLSGWIGTNPTPRATWQAVPIPRDIGAGIAVVAVAGTAIAASLRLGRLRRGVVTLLARTNPLLAAWTITVIATATAIVVGAIPGAEVAYEVARVTSLVGFVMGGIASAGLRRPRS